MEGIMGANLEMILGAFSTVLLVIQLLIVAVGLLVGLKRGVGRTAVRLGYIAVISVIAFLGGRGVAFKLSDKAVGMFMGMIPADYAEIISESPELALIFASVVGGLIAPLFIAIIFGVLHLLTLIFFKKISTGIVSSIYKKESPSWSKLAGAVLGVIGGYVIATVMLLPLNTAIYVVESIPAETVEYLSDRLIATEQGAPSAEIMPDGVLAVKPSPLALKIKFGFRLPTPKFVMEAATRYEVPKAESSDKAEEDTKAEKSYDSPATVVSKIATAVEGALKVYDNTLEKGGDSIDALTNAIAMASEHVFESATLKQTVSSAFCVVGNTLSKIGETAPGESVSILGFEIPEIADESLKDLIKGVGDIFANTTLDNVESSMELLFDTVKQDVRPDNKPQNSDAGNKADTNQSADAGQKEDAGNTGNTEDVGNTDEKKADVENNGVVAAIIKIKDSVENNGNTLNEEASDKLAEVSGKIADNEDFSGSIEKVRAYAMRIVISKGIEDPLKESYLPFYETVRDTIESVISSCRESGITSNSAIGAELGEILAGELDYYDIDVPAYYIPIAGVCAAVEFNTEEYIENGISLADVVNFLGFDESDIPEEWLK